MIKKRLLFNVLFAFMPVLCTNQLLAQTITVNTRRLAFDTTFENAPDSLPLIISNPLGRMSRLRVSGFTTRMASRIQFKRQHFIVTSQASETVWIKFAPRHNIFHNSSCLSKTLRIAAT
jgi:hypothetical protein